jgi:hypothetical protein
VAHLVRRRQQLEKVDVRIFTIQKCRWTFHFAKNVIWEIVQRKDTYFQNLTPIFRRGQAARALVKETTLSDKQLKYSWHVSDAGMLRGN